MGALRAFAVCSFILGGLALGGIVACGLSDYGKKGSNGSFVEPASGARVEVLTVQRMPTALGCEECVLAEMHRDGRVSPRLEIDINGRFGDRVRVDVSKDARWARISLVNDPPWVGVRNRGPDGSGYFQPGFPMPRATAPGDVERSYPFAGIALVDFDTNFVLRWPTATVEERWTLLSNVTELPMTQEIRGARIEWLPTVRK